jgi:hypothetical protein
MSKNNIGNGIVLLLCTITMPIAAQIVGIVFWDGHRCLQSRREQDGCTDRDSHQRSVTNK